MSSLQQEIVELVVQTIDQVIREHHFSPKAQGNNLARLKKSVSKSHLIQVVSLDGIEEIKHQEGFFKGKDDFESRHRLAREFLKHMGFLDSDVGLMGRAVARGNKYKWLALFHPTKPLVADCFSNTARLDGRGYYLSGFVLEPKSAYREPIVEED